MVGENEYKKQWITTELNYTLEYELLESVNPYFEEFELTEYGICCKLFDENQLLLSEERVNHITPKENMILDLLDKIVRNKVFPIHLYDVVMDELVAI